jgi:hypothetical protein
MNYKNRYLTDQQFHICNREKYDSKVTDNFLKEQGINPGTFAQLPIELLQAQMAIAEVERHYPSLVTCECVSAFSRFIQKLENKSRRRKLKPSAAYPIFKLVKKIKQQAYQETLIQRQKIQALRNQLP